MLREILSSPDATQEDWEALPDWMKNGISFIAQKKGQNVWVVTGFGDPVTAMNQFMGGNIIDTLRNLISMSSPGVRMPLELALNRNLFTFRPIEEENRADRYVSPVTEDLLTKLGLVKKMTGVGAGGKEYTYYTMDPYLKYLLENVPYLSTLTTGFKRVNQAAENPLEFVNMLSGARVYKRNIEREKAARAWEKNRQLDKILIQLGIAKPNTGIYLSKAATKNVPEIEQILLSLGYKPKKRKSVKKSQKKRKEKQERAKQILNNLLGIR